MGDPLPSWERRLELLLGALERARRYHTGLAQFVIYQAESVRADFEATLTARLGRQGQRARREWFQPDTPPAAHDLLGRLVAAPPAEDEVVFVYGLQHAFPELLNSLNYRRELLTDHHWRLLFWALDAEAARVIRDAPDFWAFVNQVLEIPEVPSAPENTRLAGTLAWAGMGDSEVRNLPSAERRARIALRERLLAELPDAEDAQPARADLHDTLAYLYGLERRFAEAEGHYQAALALAAQREDPALRARVMNGMGVLYAEWPTGNRAENLARAIACYQEALRFYTPEAAPLDYAITQYNLGAAYYNLPTGSRAENLARAIACYQEALRFYTPEAAPLDYAMTQNNLGIAYRNLPTGNRGENLAQAIAYYQEALRFYTPEAAPLDYAMTQNNLGIAYRNLPTGSRGDVPSHENLAQAIACFQEALRFYTPEAAPLDYAMTQYNLGNAYYGLPTGSRAENLARAIACYQEALRFYTPETAPLEYAATQNNLGNAYRDLPTGSRGDVPSHANLARAIACYQEALRFRTPEAAPLEYATTQNNLGNAYAGLPSGRGDVPSHENLARAIACYQEALRFYTPEAAPLDYAMTQNNLGVAYADLPTGSRAENLARAIACYQEALRFRTPEAAPEGYKQTRNNLGNAAYALGTVGYEQGQWAAAETWYRQAVEIAPERGNRQMALGAVLLKQGRTAEAQPYLAQARALLRDDDHYNHACLEALTGNAAAALTHLERALAERPTQRAWAARDPDLESLRADPRFAALLDPDAA